MRPLIAVTGRHLGPDRVTQWTMGALGTPRGYTDALVRAGARPAVLPPAAVGDALAGFDGLVLTGGVDIDPARYGADPHPALYGVDPELDTFELDLALAALDEELPVLAICRGHQVLNVALGGTLDQHLPDHGSTIEHGTPATSKTGGSDHEVRIAPGTLLAEALGTDRATVRSHHHQAVATLGKGLVATAWADDGVIEAMELPDREWVVSVQWHPEVTAGTDPVQQRLFDAFVADL